MKPMTSNEQGRASHPCAACGGSGVAIRTLGIPCDICLGAGTISDRMPVADALADAETLLCVGKDPGNFILAAVIGGTYVIEPPNSITCASKFGRAAARAAFRACPGLRG